ncbi:hypothetical protein ANO14919_021900 [Xylariales sp. No.14919]|nr:hypothetical protein ANO14919_021900 [Xylariales sp. No.14919]
MVNIPLTTPGHISRPHHSDLRNRPAFDHLGFLRLVPPRDDAHDTQERNPDRAELAAQRLDRIRDEVHQWMDAGDFGDADVSDDVVVDVADANNTDEPIDLDGGDDASEIIEELITANADDSGFLEPDVPVLLDDDAEQIFRSSALHNYQDFGFEASDELSNTTTSSTLQQSSYEDPRLISFAPQTSKISVFQNALAVWENQHQISRSAHTQLVEVFQLATSLDDIRSTPRRKDTLKAHFEKSLPLCKLRQVTAKLDTTQLPSKSQSTEDILAFDLEGTLTTLLSSDQTAKKIYKGMAHYTDGQLRNPWEAPWWGESIRTTSGQFHRYPDSSPIFPSDFIIWACEHASPKCDYDNCENCPGEHFGRIIWCGRDFSSAAGEAGTTGKPLLLVQRVYDRSATWPSQWFELSAAMCLSQLGPGADEFIIIEDDIISLSPSDVTRYIPDVELDYGFSPRDAHSRTKVLTAAYTVRHIWNQERKSYRPLKYSSPHRAELELRAYSREYFTANFACREVISLPFQMFVDAFGLYRNMYRSIMGMYYITQFFDASIRNRRSTVFTATLGPFGADLGDVFKVLLPSTQLDRGKELIIRGEKIFVCSFVSAIIGDMPSQQKIAGCLGPAANYPCRYCMVHTDEKHDLNFNTIMKGRYHDQILAARRRIWRECKTTSARDKQLSALGLNNDEDLVKILSTLFPALDLIRSRPADAAHSEYSGLARYLHRFFFQDKYALLTPKALNTAGELFQHFPLPPGWARLQSPRTHLESYNIHEYARGAIIIPVLLSQWLKDHHIKPQLHSFIKARAQDYLNGDLRYANAAGNFSVADWVVVATWIFAQSLIAVCGQNQTISERRNLRASIFAGRRAFQFLCQIQADALDMQSSAKSAQKLISAQRTSARNIAAAGMVGHPPNVVAQAPSEAAISQQSFMPPPSITTVGSLRRRNANPSDKRNEYLRWKQLPNVHMGLHLVEVAREYGICAMVFVLLGEDKHRQFKADIASTNHRDVTATLTRIENIRRTLSFLFAGSFEYDLPDLHNIYQQIKLRCPNLTKAIDPHLGYEEDVFGGEESYLEVEADGNHRNPCALHGISKNAVAKNNDSFLNVVNPQDPMADIHFLRNLQSASARDYNQHMLDPGSKLLQWSQKVSFTDQLKKRVCFSVGDYARFAFQDQSDFTVARIDGIFAHQQSFSNRVYLVITFARARSGDNGSHRILKCPFYDLTKERAVVGLPQIQPEKMWMVDMGTEGVIYINNDIYFM